MYDIEHVLGGIGDDCKKLKSKDSMRLKTEIFHAFIKPKLLDINSGYKYSGHQLGEIGKKIGDSIFYKNNNELKPNQEILSRFKRVKEEHDKEIEDSSIGSLFKAFDKNITTQFGNRFNKVFGNFFTGGGQVSDDFHSASSRDDRKPEPSSTGNNKSGQGGGSGHYGSIASIKRRVRGGPRVGMGR